MRVALKITRDGKIIGRRKYDIDNEDEVAGAIADALLKIKASSREKTFWGCAVQVDQADDE